MPAAPQSRSYNRFGVPVVGWQFVAQISSHRVCCPCKNSVMVRPLLPALTLRWAALRMMIAAARPAWAGDAAAAAAALWHRHRTHRRLVQTFPLLCCRRTPTRLWQPSSWCTVRATPSCRRSASTPPPSWEWRRLWQLLVVPRPLPTLLRRLVPSQTSWSACCAFLPPWASLMSPAGVRGGALERAAAAIGTVPRSAVGHTSVAWPAVHRALRPRTGTSRLLTPPPVHSQVNKFPCCPCPHHPSRRVCQQCGQRAAAWRSAALNEGHGAAAVQ